MNQFRAIRNNPATPPTGWRRLGSSSDEHRRALELPSDCLAGRVSYLLDWFVAPSSGEPLHALSGTVWGAIVDDDPGLFVEGPQSCVVEGNKTISFAVRLSARSAQTVTVNYATQDEGATSGADYVAVKGKVSFAPGERQKTVSVSLLGDRKAEWWEAFSFVLSNPVGASFMHMGDYAYVCITDDDGGA